MNISIRQNRPALKRAEARAPGRGVHAASAFPTRPAARSRLWAIALLLLLPAIASAQTNFTISWSVLSSGGGSDTGGVYSIRRVIGQPVSGKISGGGYTFASGFLSYLSALPPTDFNGIPITPLGLAGLSLQTNALRVSNLGASGVDGVAFDLGAADGASVTWLHRNPLDFPPDGYALQVRIGATVNGNPCGACLVAGAMMPNPAFLYADYSAFGANGYTARLYQGPNLVAQSSNLVTFLPGLPVGVWLRDEVRELPLPAWWKLTPVVRDGGPLRTVWEWPSGGWDIDMPGQGLVRGDRLEIIPHLTNPPTLGPISQMEFLAARIPELTILDIQKTTAGPAYNSVPVTTLGDAGLSVQSNRLVLTNIGASGVDGLSVPLNGTNGGSVTWVDRDPLTLPSGYEINVGVFGVVNGSPTRIVDVKVAGANPVWIRPDYSPLGATAYAVRIYEGTNLVATTSNLVDYVAVLDSDLRPAWWKLTPVVLDGGPLRTVFEWPGSWDIEVPGHGTVRGDRLEILPQFPPGTPNPPPSLGDLSRLQITAEHIPELVILDLNSTARPYLGIARVAGQAIITWDPPIGTLQRASSVTGPWQDTPGPAGLRTNVPSAAQKFYRVRQ